MTVKLQSGLILVDIDVRRWVLPSAFWTEVSRIGFVPVEMEIWANGTFDGDSFVLDGGRWPLVNDGPKDLKLRRGHFKVLNACANPLRVEFLN